MVWGMRFVRLGWLVGALTLAAPVAQALDSFALAAPGADADLLGALRAASLSAQALRDGRDTAQDLFAAARADYARLLGTLYARGHYSGVIRITADGREVADIAPLDQPAVLARLAIHITPGPRFAFSQAALAPLAPGTGLPEGFAAGQPALSGQIVAATRAALDGWRDLGHAKAVVAAQQLTADHRSATLVASITLRPGPQLRFGALSLAGIDRLRPERLAEIAGFPAGAVFSPAALAQIRARLRRSSIFSAATLTEAETPNPDGTLDIALLVAEAKPRRFGLGAELSSRDGFALTGYWLHRNLRGGGERFRLDAAISGIGTDAGGVDYSLGARIDRPATFTPDTSGFALARVERLNQADYGASTAHIGFGLSHYFSDTLQAEASLAFSASRVTDAFGATIFRQVSLPTSLTHDGRDVALDATRGLYLAAHVTPFLGFGSTGSGVQIRAEGRSYRAVGDSLVLAGRAQIGTVQGAGITRTPREYLFYSGGGGTVRGQPYQSLGVNVLRAGDLVPMGGASFAAFSAEIRAPLRGAFGVVAFVDAGYVAADAGFSGGAWHSGAGLGLRYDTGIGPIRLDLGLPVSGGSVGRPQLYLGIGQAF
jgi:translocation and assembly module TamA